VHSWGGAGWGLIAGLISFAFFVLVIVVLVSLLRSGVHADKASHSSALRILEERYARGEIPRDEFLERRAILMRAPPQSAP
jgi:putative membrane protein